MVPPRRRLTPQQRRAELLGVAARLFAERPYDEVQMEEIADRAGVSRALLYRHFSSKRAVFAAIYRQAADDLVASVRPDRNASLVEQVAAGLDLHFDYFAANRNTVLAANRSLAGDPVVQAIIAADHEALRERLLDITGPVAIPHDILAAVVTAWLRFVHTLCLEWLEHGVPERDQLRASCLGALAGALAAVGDPAGAGT
jgi:AcrR family transcriptional regulator